ncbi:MAG: hypothetical protein ACRDL4_13680 [Thermoleophilaceae bacterium]
MKARDVALALARGRMAIGAAFLLVPGLAGRLWIGADARRGAVKLMTRALGGRDVALGLGVVIALDRGAPVRGWLEACTLADAADFGATLLAGDSISEASRRATLLVAGGSAALGIALSRALDQPLPRGEVQAPEAALTGHPPG